MKGTENLKLIELFQLSDAFKNNILFRLGVVSSCGTRQTSEKNMRAHARLGQQVARGECRKLVSPRVACLPSLARARVTCSLVCLSPKLGITRSLLFILWMLLRVKKNTHI